MWRHAASNAITLLFFASLAAILAFWLGERIYENEGPLENAIYFEVPKGSSIGEVAQALANKGAISSKAVFRLGAKYWHTGEGPKFGSYEIPAGASMAAILEIVTTAGPRVYRYRLSYRVGSDGASATLYDRIPDGGRDIQIVKFGARDPLPSEFLEVANSGVPIDFRVAVPEGLSSWQIAEGLRLAHFLSGEIEEVPPEGSLAPDTYQVEEGSSRTSLLEIMANSQTEILEEEWQSRAQNLPIESKEQALILASIIEKETGLADERSIVSSVFANRLKAGMRLQTDPAVIYGLTKGRGSLGRGLRVSELERETPYNTYKIKGLPPTPIANPGRLAIRAALQPADTNYLYFVADGKGGHRFATNYRDHRRYVRQWRESESNR